VGHTMRVEPPSDAVEWWNAALCFYDLMSKITRPMLFNGA
jgi:hypothetical protein